MSTVDVEFEVVEDKRWAKKCVALKRKCEEYEEMNDILLSRTKRMHRMIQRAEKEKCLLVKRLEQFEVLDDIPRTDFSRGMYSLPNLNNETTLLAAAIKVRAELDKELAHTRTLIAQEGKSSKVNDHDSRKGANISSSAHYHGGDYSSASVDFRSPASSHSGAVYTPQHSPMSTSSVIVGPSNQPHTHAPNFGGAASSPSTGKIKKAARIKTGLNVSSEKHKLTGRGQSSKKKKPDADPNAPKKPSNAFFWFCQEMRPSLQEQCREEGMSGQHDLTKALAKLWSETKTEDKKHYYHKYTADKARYDREMEKYSSNKLLSTNQDAGAG